MHSEEYLDDYVVIIDLSNEICKCVHYEDIYSTQREGLL